MMNNFVKKLNLMLVQLNKERFETLKILHKANIPTIVWLSPILPFINDTKENLQGILNYCIDAKVKGIICFGMGVTLREGNREYFYKQLDYLFPHMKNKYIQTYGNSYILNSPNNKELMRLFHQICKQNGIWHDNNEQIFQYLNTFEEKKSKQSEQLSIFD